MTGKKKTTLRRINESCCVHQASSPACTELESLVMDWLGKMIGLPSDFLHARNDSLGGGVIQVCCLCTRWIDRGFIF